MKKNKTYINGDWIEGTSGKTLQSINPATGEVIAELQENSIEDVKKAIAAAKESFYVTREWRDMDVQSRSDVLLRIADMVEEELEEIAKIVSINIKGIIVWQNI